METVRSYLNNLRRFSPEARLYLLITALQGTGWGIYQLFFNFYVLSLGYRRDFLGMLISIPPLTALIVALFAGYVSDRVGYKRTMVLGSGLTVLAQALMLLVPTRWMLIGTGALRGVGMSLFSVTSAPFLMEHSSETERTHLFSFNSGVMTMSSFVGRFFGGSLPALIAGWIGTTPTASPAYAGALGMTTFLNLIALVPISRLPVGQAVHAEDPVAPFRALWRHRRPMTRLLLPSLIISLGAGMLIPFLNIFFRYRYALPDDVIGSLFGFGSLGMGVALLIAPVLAEKWGKAKTVVITQGLSIPFLIALGFVPSLALAVISFFMRMALMNLSGPVYQTMVMEESDEASRNMTASLYSMIWNFGRAVTPSISGPVQEAYGFNPVFITTIVSYGLSVYLVYRWFVRRGRVMEPQLRSDEPTLSLGQG
jgi:MFS family permease